LGVRVPRLHQPALRRAYVLGELRRRYGFPFIQPRLYCAAVETVTYGEVLARFGQALADPTRARLMLALREAPGYPAELADMLAVSRQSLSNHLACGLVVAVPEGRRVRYELADARLGHALGDLLGLVLAVDPAACPSAETDECC
jgi:ArsR family transcriptional regulator, cadmium/lead-responsive transcriptional repressor